MDVDVFTQPRVRAHECVRADANRRLRARWSELADDLRESDMDIGHADCRWPFALDAFAHDHRRRLRGRELFDPFRLIDERDLARLHFAQHVCTVNRRRRIADELTLYELRQFAKRCGSIRHAWASLS